MSKRVILVLAIIFFSFVTIFVASWSIAQIYTQKSHYVKIKKSLDANKTPIENQATENKKGVIDASRGAQSPEDCRKEGGEWASFWIEDTEYWGCNNERGNLH